MISIENISLQFGGHKIFNDISLMVGPKDRIGLVGKNGAGKSTLLKLITNELQPESGKIVLQGDISIGYLPQQLSHKNNKNVIEEALSAFSEVNKLENEIARLGEILAKRTDYESEEYLEFVELLADKNDRILVLNTSNKEGLAEQTLKGLGFNRNDFNRPTREFSGGWRMRIELAKILLRSPDVFLLDEPTNHLDIESIQWLENFLSGYRGAVILISHDRAFLDNITKRTAEISLGKLYDYKAPYSKYVELRKEHQEQLLAAYTNQQKQIEDTKEFIERFRYKATKAVQVQSRIKQLEKMDIIEIDEENIGSINIKFPPAPRSGTIVYEAQNLSKWYDQNQVLNEIDIIIERGEKIAFVGKNGEGKTTLAKIIMGQTDFTGISKNGHNVKTGYFAQNQDELLDENLTVFQTIDNVATGDIRTRVRDILGTFLFSGDDVDKKVKVLSGGEKSRLSLAKLLLEPYNLLLLDEPTNHLDMRSKDILKQALLAYDGTLILVSHDREFLSGLTDRILEFKDKKIKEYRDDIYEFLKKKNLASLHALNIAETEKSENNKKGQPTHGKLNYLQRKEIDKNIRKAEREIGSIENNIENLEHQQSEIEQKISAGEIIDSTIFEEYEKNKLKYMKLMKSWEKAHLELEKLQKEKDESMV